ncbi:MAG: hypothetical protein VXW08_05390 [Candidatus Thermoplasmatota archaeon]|nr:hypothetical protein [Candidatus Thermoplasmatota archaeon]MEC7198865.1 hypothetical protein [Candidatus Thermoplasmatota archaeon]
MKTTQNINKQGNSAYMIVPYSALKPSLDTADSTDAHIVHDDGIFEEGSNHKIAYRTVEISSKSIVGIINRARNANLIRGVA